MKKLKDPRDPLERFLANARHLAAHFGPILYQLPPRWPVDFERFQNFLRTLRRMSPRRAHAVEFREPSWYDERVYALLDKYRVALCLHDMAGSASQKLVVGPFVYVRFHFGDRKYGGAYDDQRLDDWSDWLTQRAASGLDVYAYFNNDSGGHAPRDAVRLRQRVQRRLAA
jgi:uncharacterized protein YecE (DUF72 family)